MNKLTPEQQAHVDRAIEEAIVADRAQRGEPATPPGFALVPIEHIDAFPELNLSNYGPEDVDKLNAWGIDLVSEAIPAAPQPQQPDNALGELIGCFDAAIVEGLFEAIAETIDLRLKDLLERRLMVGYQRAISPTPQQPEPLTDDEIRPLIPQDSNWRYVVEEVGALEFARSVIAAHEAKRGAAAPTPCIPAGDGVCESVECANHRPEPLTDAEIREWWASENGLEDCDMCDIDDFKKVVRAVIAAHEAKQRGVK